MCNYAFLTYRVLSFIEKKILLVYIVLMFFRKNLVFLPFFLIFVFFLEACSNTENQISFFAMDTFMSIKSYGKDSKKINQQVQKRIEYLDSIFSTTNEKSEVYKLNHSQGEFTKVSDELKNLIEFSLKMSDETEGVLNITLYPIILEWGFTTENYKVPSNQKISDLLAFTDYKKIEIKDDSVKLPQSMMIDLGSIGKGFAGDEAIKIFRQNGIKSAILDLGGNVQTLGVKTDGSKWNVGIKNPFDKSVMMTVKVENEAVITSGGYERFFVAEDGTTYIHIFDSKTGFPVDNEIASITIISQKGVYADALSTSLFAMGKEKALSFWENHKDFRMILILKDGTIIER